MRFGESAQPRGDRARVHQSPTLPVVIDEERADARSVREFNGRPLITVVDGDALDGRLLHIFTSREQAAAYVEAAEAPASTGKRGNASRLTSAPAARGTVTHALTVGPLPGAGFYEMYDLDDLGGCYWRISSGMASRSTTTQDGPAASCGGDGSMLICASRALTHTPVRTT